MRQNRYCLSNTKMSTSDICNENWKTSVLAWKNFIGRALVWIVLFLALLRLACFEDFCAKTTGSHMALRERNSGTESSRDLLKGWKDVVSLLACTRKKFLFGVCGFFVSDIISGGLSGHLGPLHLALDPNC